MPALILAALLVYLAGTWGGDRALGEMAAQARAAAQLNSLALRSSLDKFRSVPFVLAHDPEVRAALQSPQPGRIQQLDRKLSTLSQGVGASAVYLLNDMGLAIAASNWDEPATFVGVDYRFRPYFQRAKTQGNAEYFALGTVSHEPGLYLSRRIDDTAGGMLGVIVLKIDFTLLEHNWDALDATLFVTDDRGVVLMGNVAAWRFHITDTLPPGASAAMRAELQFGEGPFEPLPVTLPEHPPQTGALVRARQALRGARAGTPQLYTALPVDGTDHWTLHMLSPVQGSLDRAATNAQLATLLVLTAVGLTVGLFLYRHGQARRRAQAQATIRAELENQVQQRTGELRRANTELQAMMDARQQDEARLHRMQDELVQANKLALLGQVAAGVAHEINQPVAAIRAYADNTTEFVRRGQQTAVLENLQTIAAMTERIGGITGELRAFSRKSTASVAPTRLDEALQGALLLVGHRIKREGVRLDQPAPHPRRYVLADRMRLEQVFVNLLQNALDALRGCADPHISIDVDATSPDPALASSPAPGATPGAPIRIHIRDNGPGLAPHVRERLFTPFQTTKPEGLGLGLIICRDILTEFGGALHAADIPPPGALFTVTLAAAPAPDPA